MVIATTSSGVFGSNLPACSVAAVSRFAEATAGGCAVNCRITAMIEVMVSVPTFRSARLSWPTVPYAPPVSRSFTKARDDKDTHGDSLLAVEHGRHHDGAVFGEGVMGEAAATPGLLRSQIATGSWRSSFKVTNCDLKDVHSSLVS